MDNLNPTVDTKAPKATRHALLWTIIGYGVLVLATIAGFLLIRSYGETLSAPPAAVAAPLAAAAGKTDILLLLLALAAVIIVGRLLAPLLARLAQPPVIGEVLAGLLLGPSLLGPETSALILPPAVAPYLSVIAQLGVILYMFIVGLEVNAGLFKHRAQAIVGTSQASIIAPFLLGALLALVLYPQLSNSNVPFTSFALFLGLALSITAFPVLARILTDFRMNRSELGVIALSCAAINDVTAWCLLALVIGIINANAGQAWFVIGGTLIYIAAMLAVVRPLLNRAAAQQNETPRQLVVLIFIALLLSATSTEFIGIHAIFGAFLLGAVIPHDSTIARTLSRQLEPVVTVLLLPAFFAFVGMRTQINLIAGLDQWLLCGLIIVVATLGKFGGACIASRLTGLDWHHAAALGALMNTRGLMELIVLSIGLDLGVISPTLFAMMVLMALVTTMSTAPLLRLLKLPQDGSGK
jgi:Kef-type K+ transport system membrane component KefB